MMDHSFHFATRDAGYVLRCITPQNIQSTEGLSITSCWICHGTKTVRRSPFTADDVMVPCPRCSDEARQAAKEVDERKERQRLTAVALEDSQRAEMWGLP